MFLYVILSIFFFFFVNCVLAIFNATWFKMLLYNAMTLIHF